MAPRCTQRSSKKHQRASNRKSRSHHSWTPASAPAGAKAKTTGNAMTQEDADLQEFIESLSARTVGTTILTIFCGLILLVSRMNCFHIHLGIVSDIHDITVTRTEKVVTSRTATEVEGYTDYHMRVDAKILYDHEAKTILKENPDLKLKDLDLGLLYSTEELGLGRYWDPARTTVEKAPDDMVIRVTGEMIQEGLRKQREALPTPQGWPTNRNRST